LSSQKLKKRNNRLVLIPLLIILSFTLGYYVKAQTELSFETVIENGSMVETASYVIFKDGSYYYAKNGTTGAIDYSGVVASTVIQDAVNAGNKIDFSNGNFNIGTVITLKAFSKIQGSGESTVFVPTGDNSIFKFVAEPYTESPIELSNFRIKDFSSVTSTAYALDLYGCGGSTFQDITIIDYVCGIKVEGELGAGAQNNNWKSIHMELRGGTGLLFFGAYINDNRFENIYVYGKNYFAGALVNFTSTGTIGRDGCQFSDITILSGGHQKYGMVLAGRGTSWFNNIVIDSTGNDATGASLKIIKSDYYPEYNWFNNVYLNAYAGRCLSIEGDGSGLAQRFYFTNLEVNSATEDGVYLYYCADIVFYGTVRDSTKNGYHLLYSDGIHIHGFVIGNDQYGIYREYGSNNEFNDIAFGSNSLGDYSYVAGSNNLIHHNIGYITENSGTQTVANGETVSHGLAGTPTSVTVTARTLVYDSNVTVVGVTNRGASTFTVGAYWTNGTAITTDAIVIDWYAEYKP